MEREQQRLSPEFGKIKLVVSDVDGTLSRGIVLDASGEELKVFCEKDAARIQSIVHVGIPFIMISGRNSGAARARAKELNVFFYWRKEMKHARGPLAFLEETHQVRREEILYIGDDWPDLWWMEHVGVAATPSDANGECLKRAHVIAQARGARGRFRKSLWSYLRSAAFMARRSSGSFNLRRKRFMPRVIRGFFEWHVRSHRPLRASR